MSICKSCPENMVKKVKKNISLPFIVNLSYIIFDVFHFSLIQMQTQMPFYLLLSKFFFVTSSFLTYSSLHFIFMHHNRHTCKITCLTFYFSFFIYFVFFIYFFSTDLHVTKLYRRLKLENSMKKL